MDFITKLAVGDEQNTDEEAEADLVLTEILRLYKDRMKKLFGNVGLEAPPGLSADVAIGMKSLLHLSWSSMRNMRRLLVNSDVRNTGFLPSEGSMRKIVKERTQHISNSKLDVGVKGLMKTATSATVTACPYARVLDLPKFIEEICKKEELRFPDGFDGKIWLLFAGDKGGGTMKWHFECLNTDDRSVDNVHIYCMYEATDNVENMWKMWAMYHKQIKIMSEDSFLLLGRKVEIFLGGDFHFLDDTLGHQGSSSTYCSSTDMVTLKHLQESHKDGSAHTPDTCQVEPRTLAQYKNEFNENYIDERNSFDRHKNGHFHANVAEAMLFPLKYEGLEQVVPPVLHIMIGIVLNIYNELVDDCKKLDADENIKDIKKKEKISDSWEIASVKLGLKRDEMLAQANNVIDWQNRIARLAAVEAGNMQQNE